MARIFLTASARRDLDEIWEYIAIENHSPDAADGLIDEIDSRLGELSLRDVSWCSTR